MNSQPEPRPPGESVPSGFAAFLSSQREEITKRWLDAVRRNPTFSVTKEVDDEELADHLPRLFEDLAATLSGQRVADAATRDAEAHGEHRWRQQYSLEEILLELGIVNRIVLGHGLDAYADAHPDTPTEQLRGARERILRFFEDASADSVRRYVERSNRQTRAKDLSLSEQRRLALDSAQMGWWHLDLASKQLFCDERFRTIFGTREEAVSYDWILSIIHPDDREGINAAVQAAVRPVEPAPYSVECRVVREDGSVRRVTAKGQASFEGEGAERCAVSLVGTVTDVTEANATRDALSLSEERHRLAIEGAQLGTFSWDIASRQIHWNARMKELFFLPPDAEVSFEAGIARLHPDDREPTRKAVEAALAGRTSYQIEYRSVNPADGQVRWLHATGHPFADAASGEMTQVHGVVVDMTARKLAQQQAIAAAQRERTVLESITDRFFAFDAEWRYTYLNEAAKRGMAGHVEDPSALIGQNFFDVFPAARGTAIEEGYLRAVAEGVMVEYEVFYEPWGRWYESRCYPIQGGGLSVYFRDVTEEKQAAQTLAASEAKYRSLFNSIDAGFCVFEMIWDERGEPVDYRYLEVNAAFEQQTGLTDAAGRTARECIPGLEPHWPAIYGQVARTGEPIRSTEGSAALGRWYDLYAFPVGTGQPRQVAVLFNDITARRRSEEMMQAAKAVLQESEAKFRQLADAMPQIVWAARPDGVLDYTNRRWYEYIRLTEAEWNVADWHLRVHPDDLARVGAEWARCLGSGEPYVTEFRVRRGDGEYRWFLVRALPIREEDGRIARWYGTCTDIQEQRALLEQNAQLLVSERAARAEGERIGRMKDEFLATLSHELRTPLNAILGWTQVLHGDPANTEEMEMGLATIERNARAQNAIIEDLLDMSKIVSGKVRLDVQPLDLEHVVKSAVESMRPGAAAKGIRLQALIDPEARMISGDPNRLQQVFWNLLSNAIKFTPREGRVQVVLARVNSHLEVSVTDSGEGIAAEFLPYVFDRFRQQDASTTRRHGGLGLGLAIVKQLVELHGGSIRVESAGTGQGTTFRVLLPLWVVRPDVEPSGDERVHPKASGTAPLPVPSEGLNLAGVRVVVVDDEGDARALVKRLLEDRGASVRVAASTAEALELLAAQPPDVLVSDIGMPGEDGYALIRQVRALPAEAGGNVPAVALTAYARSEDRLRVILAGFQMHLAKPVEAAELLALVASLAGRVTPG